MGSKRMRMSVVPAVLLLVLSAAVFNWMWRDSDQGVGGLIKRLQDENPNVRFHAAKALADIGSTAVPDLITALQDEDQIVRHEAASALGRLGPATEEVVPALIKALKDEDTVVRLQAATALGRIGPTEQEENNRL